MKILGFFVATIFAGVALGVVLVDRMLSRYHDEQDRIAADFDEWMLEMHQP